MLRHFEMLQLKVRRVDPARYLYDWSYYFLLVLFHFSLKFFWSFLFFDYPTLDDVARVFTFMHSLQTKDIYIYQLDVSYHGVLLYSLLYYPFVKLFGTDITIFRTAHAFLSALTLLIAFALLKDKIKRDVFFILFTFSPIFFNRNSLLIGNYAFIPMLVILTIKTKGFAKGLFLGLSICNHPLALLLGVLIRNEPILRLILGLFVGLLPLLTFNLYNLSRYGTIPTLEDMTIRAQVFSFEFIKGDPVLMSVLILFLPIIKMAKDVRTSLLVFLLLFVNEERQFVYLWTVLIWLAAERFSRNNAMTHIPLISIIWFLSNIPSVGEYSRSYIMYPYGKRHYIAEEKEIKGYVSCAVELLGNSEKERLWGDVISTGFLKFYNPHMDIYYYLNFWSYIVPVEFKGDARFIVVYDEKQERGCPFFVQPAKIKQENLYKNRYGKIRFRETGLRVIFHQILLSFLEAISKLTTSMSYADMWTDDENLGWTNNRNYKGLIPSVMGFPKFYVELNEQGGRDTMAWREENLRGKRRILILGDSVCFGFGMNFEETVGEQIERILGGKWVVLNMSVVGYSTDQELLLLKMEGIRYNPNVVIFCLWVNDLPGILDSSPLENGGRGKPVFVLRNNELELHNVPPKSVSLFPELYNKMFILVYGKYALNFYLKRGYKSLVDKIRARFYLLQDLIAQCIPYRMILYRDVVDNYIKLLSSLMTEARKVCGHICQVYLVLIPDHDQVIGKKAHVERIYSRIAEEIDHVKVINIELKEDDFFPKNQHPNSRGHRKMAEQIAKVLIAENNVYPR